MSLREWLIEYCEQVLAGEIIACQKHRWAARRFLRDIEREGTDAFPYMFGEEKALRFFRWMRLFRHTKGKLQGERIEPAPIQVFVFGQIYGWAHKDTGLRRFRNAYWQVGRKNAKSQSLACVGSYEAMALGESMSEVYIGAAKSEQSQIVWKEIKAQLLACPDLKGKYAVRYGKIEHPKSQSFIAALSKDEGQTGDGKNVQCAIIDEYHAHKNSEILAVLQTGTVARTQPLTMIITTAGYNLSYPCYEIEYKYVSKLLDPDLPVENDEYFALVNELDPGDDIKDEAVWEKANPILCSYEEGIASLRSELRKALDAPQKMRDFLTKNMDLWVDQKDNGYMSSAKWQACQIGKESMPAEMPDLRGRHVFIGVDLSSKLDLTSVGFEFPLDDGKYLVLSHSFMPEDRVAEKRSTDKVPYDLWIRQGYITATPGAVVDLQFLVQYIEDQVKEHGWKPREVCVDPWGDTWFATEMTNRGYTVVEIRQGPQTLAGPTKTFRDLVYQQKVIHDGNSVLAWAISNAVTRQDHNGNITLDKSKATDRIDPIAALINAHVRAGVTEVKKPSVYETRGVLTF